MMRLLLLSLAICCLPTSVPAARAQTDADVRDSQKKLNQVLVERILGLEKRLQQQLAKSDSTELKDLEGRVSAVTAQLNQFRQQLDASSLTAAAQLQAVKQTQQQLEDFARIIRSAESGRTATSAEPALIAVAATVPLPFREYLAEHPALLTADASADMVAVAESGKWMVIAVGQSPHSVKNPKVACRLKALAALTALQAEYTLRQSLESGDDGGSDSIKAGLAGKVKGLPVIGEWTSTDGKHVSVLYGRLIEPPAGN